ncbi:uncharacterized protein CDAR_273361 [Caerostris darwini]|uniref:Uncharacterized protein n=1 Tax=Caerostris darwini TaxID=1538125 RepID=A0AAV4W2P5_9ARAC|nr:uncharacterized protein CDAR_273361 [Caerostris darwini]
MTQIPASLILSIPLMLNVWPFSKELCPPPETLEPCRCQGNKSYAAVLCEDVFSEDDLTSVMTAIKDKPIDGVELRSVSMRYIPEDAFDGTNLKSIEIVNSSIMSLSENEHAFKGLEDTLLILRVINCSYASVWDWTLLERLNKLKELEISNSNLIELEDEFLKLARLPMKIINFRDNNLKELPYKAFSAFTSLKQLHLGKNALQSVERSLLPLPAKKLHTLGLSQNKIEELPVDMFTQMPKLRFLFLEGNPILIVDAKTFQPVWNQLKIIFLNNALHCDCRMSWMTEMKEKLRLLQGACSSPPRLRGRKIALLKSEELVC